MTKTALLIHGAFGTPDENWFPWLSVELEALGYEVMAPTFPTPEGQNLLAWEAVMTTYLDQLGSDSIIIGHSLGVSFGLRLIKRLDHPVHAFFGASGFAEKLGDPTFDHINQTFVTRDWDWEKIKAQCANFYLYHGDDDPYVPTNCAQNLAERLEAPLQIVSNGGHLNEAAGFTEFLQLLEDIKSIS